DDGSRVAQAARGLGEVVKRQVIRQDAPAEAQVNAAENEHSGIAAVGGVVSAPGETGPTRVRNIFGGNVFTSESLSFEPNENQATPQNYRLGPGDEVVIDIWGASEDRIREVISPEGSIIIEQLGPIFLNGMTIEEANNHLRSQFAYKYAGVEENETDVSLTLGQVRTIQVNVMGEVRTPGTYRLSPFATVFNALYRSGGITEIGSLRNVEVLRGGRRVATVDVYEYLFGGKSSSNIRLEEGDVIMVPAYTTMVQMEGNVKRPMYYEAKAGESLADILHYAGGFGSNAYTEAVRLSRRTGKDNELFNVRSDEFATFRLSDGDIVTVGEVLDRYSNRVQLRGQAMRPGFYALGTDVATLRDLIAKADGLKEDAYTQRVLIYREGPDLTLQVVPVDIAAVLAGTAPDVQLKRNDIIEIASIQEILDRGGFTIQGLVSDPGTYPYAENTTIEDLILQAGGLLQGASTARIEVSRRMLDPNSTRPVNETAQLFTFSYNEGNPGSGFTLEPYDIVTVRKSPVYVAQQRVAIGGEVAFEGPYTISRRNERISDLVRRAGGLTNAAYVRGAHLSRQMTEDEMTARDETMRIARMMQGGDNTDSISTNKLILSNRYNVGIELEKALANPGCDEDLVLQEGDALFIPQLVNTVRVQGDVMYPNTVVFKKGQKLKYYINQAGGYGSRAKKSKAYIVYLNGTVALAKGSTPIEPGCQIIVPSKAPSKGVD
ncbi:MAG: SLBB domain-containing protein, partial [Duncaniella sp.]|nr:SLBB domain-containing protein [Duncaniella sp.]